MNEFVAAIALGIDVNIVIEDIDRNILEYNDTLIKSILFTTILYL